MQRAEISNNVKDWIQFDDCQIWKLLGLAMKRTWNWVNVIMTGKNFFALPV